MKTITYNQAFFYLFVFILIFYSSLETLYSIGFVDITVDLQEVPSKVRTIINDRLQNGELVSLSLNNEDHGLHYDAIIRIKNGTESLQISPLGKIIDESVFYNQYVDTHVTAIPSVENRHDIVITKVPEFTIPSSVSAQVQRQFPSAVIERNEQTEDGHYKLVLNYQGSVVECIYHANGQLDKLQSFSPSEYAR